MVDDLAADGIFKNLFGDPAGAPGWWAPVSSQHPHWCVRELCTAQTEGGLHIGRANRVPLGENPSDALSLQLIQAVTSQAEPDPPVQVGINWHGCYAKQQKPIVIRLDRAKFFAAVLAELVRTP